MGWEFGMPPQGRVQCYPGLKFCGPLHVCTPTDSIDDHGIPWLVSRIVADICFSLW